MSYESYKPLTKIVEFGEMGKLFYVIISGSCDIWVPVAHKEIKLIIKDFIKRCQSFTDPSFFQDSIDPS